jgi:repressor LexA
MNVGDRIRERRKAIGLSAEQVAENMGVSPATIYRYESADIMNMRIDKLEPIAKVLRTTPAYLMGWVEDSDGKVTVANLFPIDTKKFPLLGEIACGKPVYAQEDFESYVEAGANIKADFCLRCKGDSMVNARILDGDIVFIKEQSMVNNGEIAAVIIEDEATLKRVFYYPDKSKLVLQAENSHYEPLIYVGEELNQVRIIGKAVVFQSDVR